MIARRRDYIKKAPSRDAHKIYVVCEGASSEPDYFNFFRGLSMNLDVITIPPEDGKTDPIKLKENAEATFLNANKRYELDYKQGDVVWFVIDTDTWEEEGKVEILREFCLQKNETIAKEEGYSPWKVAQSNPSFEIWMYYHLFENKPSEENIAKYSTFKEFVNNCFSGGYNYESDPVRIGTAIINSRNNFTCKNGKLGIFSTEVYCLAEEILRFVKEDINRLINKLK